MSDLTPEELAELHEQKFREAHPEALFVGDYRGLCRIRFVDEHIYEDHNIVWHWEDTNGLPFALLNNTGTLINFKNIKTIVKLSEGEK